MVLEGVHGALGGVGEPTVVRAAGQAGVLPLVAEESDGQPVLHQSLGQVRQHEGGSGVQSVQHPHQRGTEVTGATGTGWRVLAGQTEEVVAFVEGEPQPAGQRGQHLLRGVRSALLLQPCVVVGRHSGQRGDLLASQPTSPASGTNGQADVFGSERVAATAEEVSEVSTVQPPSMAGGSTTDQGTRIPRSSSARDCQSLDERSSPGPRQPTAPWFREGRVPQELRTT